MIKMSEHMKIKGKVDYWHLPYDEEGAFTFCNHCEETCDKVSVEFHQGWMEDWMNVNCGKCKKSIWTSKLKRKMTKDDKKCHICGKPTNWVDCSCKSFRVGEGRDFYTCSERCYNIDRKLALKINFFIDEIGLCLEEQGYDFRDEDVAKTKFSLARELALAEGKK